MRITARRRSRRRFPTRNNCVSTRCWSSAGATWKLARGACVSITVARKARSRRRKWWRIFWRASKSGGRKLCRAWQTLTRSQFMKNDLNHISRRNFLTVSGAAAAVMAAQATKTTAFAALAANEAAPPASPVPDAKKYPIGLELYSVRTELARDLPNTLRTVAKMGFEVVEFYAPYFSWTIPYAKEVRTLMDDLGLRCYSTHNNIESFKPGSTMNKAIELNQILGARYLILASEPG